MEMTLDKGRSSDDERTWDLTKPRLWPRRLALATAIVVLIVLYARGL